MVFAGRTLFEVPIFWPTIPSLPFHATCRSQNMGTSHSQMLGKVESGGETIFKVVLECLKRRSEPFLSISMAYNVISCQKVAENTQILKIAKFAM